MRCVLAALVLLGSTAAAENERALSIGLGFASFSAPGEPEMMNQAPPSVSPDWGSGAVASHERMFGSDIGLRVELAGQFFRGGNSAKQSATSYAVLGDAGLVFRFDVLHYVPYALAGIGAVKSWGGPIDRDIDYVLTIGGGLDWLRSRTRSYGIEVRLSSFAGEITVATVGVRGTHRWGFF